MAETYTSPQHSGATAGVDANLSMTADATQKQHSYQPIPQGTPTQYVGFWPRVLAFVVDVLICEVIGFVVSLTFGIFASFFLPSMVDDTYKAQQVVSKFPLVLPVVIAWLYFASQEASSRQATLGKRLIGAIVVNENGGRLTFTKATIRVFAKVLSTLTFLFGYLLVAFSPKSQGLHDVIAFTYVVKKPKV